MHRTVLDGSNDSRTLESPSQPPPQLQPVPIEQPPDELTVGVVNDDNNDDDDDGNISSPPLPTSELTVLPTMNDVMACQCSVWYPIFSNLPHKYRKRTNVTIRSQIIKPLPTEFIQYLLSNHPSHDQRFILPQNARTSSALLEANHHRDDDSDAWSSSSHDSHHVDVHDEGDNDDTSTDTKLKHETTPKIYSFPELNEQIRTAIQSFHNNPVCIPKLNWSSPKDAIWINGNQNTMECRTAGDVYLLLKASDFIAFDLLYARTDVLDPENNHTDDVQTTNCDIATKSAVSEQPPAATASTNEGDTTRYDNTNEMSRHPFSYELVIRKFCNLYPSQEFRCFVSYNTLLGISQRYQQYHFPFLPERRQEYSILIYDFYIHVVRPNVHRMSHDTSSSFQQYIFDIYIDQQQRIWIIDFNVWGTRTDAILFHWSELLVLANEAKWRWQQSPHHMDDTNEHYDTNENTDAMHQFDFRIVESLSSPPSNHANHPQPQPPPIHPNPLSNYKAPMDALFLSNHHHHHGDAIHATTFQDFMNLCVRPSTINDHNGSSDSSSSSSSSSSSDSDAEA